MESTTRTRSGRISKPPTRYEPVEQVEDDYASDDYDADESDVSSVVSYSEDDDDASSLEDFIEDDEDDSDKSEDEVETNGRRVAATPIPVKKRGVPAAAGARRPRGQSASPRQPHAFPTDALPPAAST